MIDLILLTQSYSSSSSILTSSITTSSVHLYSLLLPSPFSHHHSIPSSKPTVIHEPVTTDFNHVRAQNIYQKFHKFRLMVSGAFFGPGVASCCTILSVIGVIFLVSIGIAFENNAHVLMGSTESPENGKKVARVCFASAIVYACLVGFCSCQLSANRRIARGGEVHLR